VTYPTLTAIEAAILNLQARQPNPRGRKQELARFVPQLRELIAAGWTRAEIIGEIKACGAQMSPALLRDVLQIAPAKPKQVNRPKQAKPILSDAPTPTSPPEPETAPLFRGQPAPAATPLYNGQPDDGAEAE
jgi:hypothetical protein